MAMVTMFGLVVGMWSGHADIVDAREVSVGIRLAYCWIVWGQPPSAVRRPKGDFYCLRCHRFGLARAVLNYGVIHGRAAKQQPDRAFWSL
jgi:hypothetical protein